MIPEPQGHGGAWKRDDLGETRRAPTQEVL